MSKRVGKLGNDRVGPYDPALSFNLDGGEDADIEVVSEIDTLTGYLTEWREDSCSIGLVPVLGEAHVGHLVLLALAARECDRVLVAAGPKADVLTDPVGRTLLSRNGADVLYAASMEIEPVPVDDLPEFAASMEGLFARDALTEAVGKIERLVELVAPDRLYQSGAVFQRACVLAARLSGRDGAPLIRVVDAARGPGGITPVAEIDRLDEAGRERVASLSRILGRMTGRLADGVSTPAGEVAWGLDALTDAAFDGVDYLEIRHPRTLEPVERAGAPARVFVAVRIGDIRFVDSVPVRSPDADR
ncbi:pantoate--beta-alanine ligase [Thalassobaculum sp. OXR-137]|uniref:pantoate--beta-alanine ligase n=1 Tax=Thalassobaculum sp. OXR-137 TaxID=3100173 RepID=UPI002AC8E2AA|nr:pantoate--beta-alanine ligase [Thalassobaculum sp. OXR-137]WPZ34787.1 pantoate--beta-alanine ligase [Thalassobaculum sp. OXR-137]